MVASVGSHVLSLAMASVVRRCEQRCRCSPRPHLSQAPAPHGRRADREGGGWAHQADPRLGATGTGSRLANEKRTVRLPRYAPTRGRRTAVEPSQRGHPRREGNDGFTDVLRLHLVQPHGRLLLCRAPPRTHRLLGRCARRPPDRMSGRQGTASRREGADASFRDNWDRVFGPKRPVRIIRNPFQLRVDVEVRYEVPVDFNIRDLRRLVRHLGTMCEDWEPEMGFAEVEYRLPSKGVTK